MIRENFKEFLIKLNPDKRSEIESTISLLKKYCPVDLNLENGAWLSGGAINTFITNLIENNNIHKNINDYDLFFKTIPESVPVGKITHRLVTTDSMGLVGIFKKRVEMLWQFSGEQTYQNIEDMFNSFDFTVSQFATDLNEIVYTPEALIDVQMKHINLHKNYVYNNRLILRLNKYLNKGYTTSAMTDIYVLRSIPERLHDFEFEGSGY